MSAIPETVETLLLSPNKAAALAGISATRLREAIRLGNLKAVMVGSHCRILRTSLTEYVANLPPYRKAARHSRPSRKPAKEQRH
jgi:excisionase family DNA binding protein